MTSSPAEALVATLSRTAYFTLSEDVLLRFSFPSVLVQATNPAAAHTTLAYVVPSWNSRVRVPGQRAWNAYSGAPKPSLDLSMYETDGDVLNPPFASRASIFQGLTVLDRVDPSAATPLYASVQLPPSSGFLGPFGRELTMFDQFLFPSVLYGVTSLQTFVPWFEIRLESNNGEYLSRTLFDFTFLMRDFYPDGSSAINAVATAILAPRSFRVAFCGHKGFFKAQAHPYIADAGFAPTPWPVSIQGVTTTTPPNGDGTPPLIGFLPPLVVVDTPTLRVTAPFIQEGLLSAKGNALNQGQGQKGVTGPPADISLADTTLRDYSAAVIIASELDDYTWVIDRIATVQAVTIFTDLNAARACVMGWNPVLTTVLGAAAWNPGVFGSAGAFDPYRQRAVGQTAVSVSGATPALPAHLRLISRSPGGGAVYACQFRPGDNAYQSASPTTPISVAGSVYVIPFLQ